MRRRSRKCAVRRPCRRRSGRFGAGVEHHLVQRNTAIVLPPRVTWASRTWVARPATSEARLAGNFAAARGA